MEVGHVTYTTGQARTKNLKTYSLVLFSILPLKEKVYAGSPIKVPALGQSIPKVSM